MISTKGIVGTILIGLFILSLQAVAAEKEASCTAFQACLKRCEKRQSKSTCRKRCEREQSGVDIDQACGVPCGPVTYPAGKICCNKSCGICTEPGGFCIALHCDGKKKSEKKPGLLQPVPEGESTSPSF